MNLAFSQLRHIYVGRAHRREGVRLLIADANVRVIREDGQLVQNVLQQVSSMS